MEGPEFVTSQALAVEPPSHQGLTVQFLEMPPMEVPTTSLFASLSLGSSQGHVAQL